MSLPVESQSQYESHISSEVANLALMETALGALLTKQATLAAALTGEDYEISDSLGSQSSNRSAQMIAIGGQIRLLSDSIEAIRTRLNRVPFMLPSRGC